MTQAEDVGYNDTYFPASDDPAAPPFDPSAEYLLSHSPPEVPTTTSWESPQSEPSSPGWSENSDAQTVPPPARVEPKEDFRPKAERRRSKSSHQPRVAEAVFFSYGVSVFFGFEEGQERDVMEDCLTAGVWTRPLEEDGWETEECHYVVRCFRSNVLRLANYGSSMTRTRITRGFTMTCSVRALTASEGG
jgi:uncharacterized Rmd1/YagE family protein